MPRRFDAPCIQTEMKSKIIGITVQRNMRAGKHGITRSTVVFFIREDSDKTSIHYTNDILERGNISDASVIRAKRAQLALMERNMAQDAAAQ